MTILTCHVCQAAVESTEQIVGAKKFTCDTCKSTIARDKRLKKLFNLDAADYDKILAHQNGACYICRKPPKKGHLAVDHNHKTGQIRGLLCFPCNRALGKFRDDDELLKRAAEYCATPPATAALGGDRFGLKGRVTNKAKTRKKLNPGMG